MDDNDETRRSGGIVAVIVVLVALVLLYSGGYVYYRWKMVGDFDFHPDFGIICTYPGRGTLAGKAFHHMYHPILQAEARIRGKEVIEVLRLDDDGSWVQDSLIVIEVETVTQGD